MSAIVITGTDTGIGKTIFSAGLTRALRAQYWKPVQAGLEEETDSELVARLSGCKTLPEAYRLNMPASPHLAAEDMGIVIEKERLKLPQVDGSLVVEGAGGVMVPVTREDFYLDVFAQWKAPIILVARTALGTINHSALSLMALRQAGLDVVGVAFVGEAEPDVENTIADMCNVAHLGRLPMLSDLTQSSIAGAFESIDVETIRRAL